MRPRAETSTCPNQETPARSQNSSGAAPMLLDFWASSFTMCGARTRRFSWTRASPWTPSPSGSATTRPCCCGTTRSASRRRTPRSVRSSTPCRLGWLLAPEPTENGNPTSGWQSGGSLKKPAKETEANLFKCWQEWQGSNLRPPVLETGALPIELHSYRDLNVAADPGRFKHRAGLKSKGEAPRRAGTAGTGRAAWPPSRPAQQPVAVVSAVRIDNAVERGLSAVGHRCLDRSSQNSLPRHQDRRQSGMCDNDSPGSRID
ncbi:MAG: hypothetical protein QOJ96_974 [Alphaproteobacteria bacterium]|nr:hypothetical protein [Alphaproteobacteria bacterium]